MGLLDPPHRHDVARELNLVRNKFDKKFHRALSELETANHWLRREREMSFYGADDSIPPKATLSRTPQELFVTPS